MKKVVVFAALSVVGFDTFAGVKFHCYSMPNMPVQTYEYASSNCGGFPTRQEVSAVVKEGQQDVMCMYSAACEPVEAGEPDEPPERSVPEINDRFMKGKLKASILVCKGIGSFEKNIITKADCPTATKCQRDIFYNFAPTSISPMVPQRVSVPIQPREQIQ